VHVIDINNFDAIKIGLASTKQIHDWSSGEVTKPETINYRTLKPEKDGLFCERIFGPTKDWECYCGKYKRVRYKGIICERCGVEVTRQKVRRERMGHIDLAAPVSHIWFFKGVPSRIGYLLDIAPKELEKVLYFAASIVVHVDDEKRLADLGELSEKVEAEVEQLAIDREEQFGEVEERLLRRREFFASGATEGFDEDDEYWARTLATWADDQGFPQLEEARELASGVLKDVARRIAGEDTRKVRELVRSAAVREDRQLSARELDAVAAWAKAALDADEKAVSDAREGKGTAKSNGKKAIERLALYLAGDADALDAKKDDGLVERVLEQKGETQKELDRARGLGGGLLADVVRAAIDLPEEERDELRDLANDLCLKTDGRMSKDDVKVLEAWALKVREAYLDAQARRKDADEATEERVETLRQAFELFKEIKPKDVVGDERLFRELHDRFGSDWGFGVYFGGGMGAEAIRELLRREDLDHLELDLRETIKTSKGQRQQRAIKRLKVVSAFRESDNKPDWMVLDAIPVIPPELRPMVQLDGGRFATSDLNDLYRRVINRNNRLKRLLDLGAPEIIVNNEKRMLQEAVDALFDNGRRGRAVTGPGNRPLKSLSDMLKGKQGRFRQNLLGKRVDYSGRSVIVSGPTLKLHQCGLPKLMALELFKPFIMSRLVERKAVQNIKAAKKMVDSMVPEVWDVLEEVIAEHPVLLNRAPTLHRLGIQAFEPILVEGKAIQVHPLVCHAFNADFDGDQMAVHLPLSVEAQAEARILMLSSNNILSPAHGKPLATPTQDLVIGIYYLTYSLDENLESIVPGKDVPLRLFGSADSVSLAVSEGQLGLQDTIWYRRAATLEKLVTTAGRVIFNNAIEEALYEAMGDEFDAANHEWINTTMRKSEISDYVSRLVDVYGASQVAPVLDAVKDLGFLYATQAGVSISKNDIVTPDAKGGILERIEKEVAEVGDQYQFGLITDSERHEKVVILWGRATDEVEVAMRDSMWRLNPIYMMAHSGARGSFKQIRQLAGMRGLMANPKGEIIERPIKANFMEGLSVLEYFISTHGARKGLADTALRTADSGYLTRRLVDVSQDVIIREDDCGTDQSIEALLYRSGRPNRALVGRVLADEIKIGDQTIPANTPLDGEVYAALLEEYDEASDLRLRVRSVLKCESEVGVCRSCYGFSLATGEMSEIGDAVGIVAAQSIGEPGTQLTMRTFHEGGVAGSDITHGLPRVVELFEARNPKGAAVLAQVSGIVTREDTERGARITVTPDAPANGDEEGPVEELYQLPRRTIVLVRSGDRVERGQPLMEGPLNPAELLLLRLDDPTVTELYIVAEVLRVYESQGVEINDKHIELIVRQMLKKARVDDAGDTRFLPGQLVDRARILRENRRVEEEKSGETAQWEPVILGITKASLATESFLSAASFQETTKVLTDAAIEGKIDRLNGLKENVIIGKLIPASTGLRAYRRIEITPGEGAELYDRDRLLADVAAQITVDSESEALIFGPDADFGFGDGAPAEEE
jgi:DNA-directed RNA polymerase subunit beta'